MKRPREQVTVVAAQIVLLLALIFTRGPRFEFLDNWFWRALGTALVGAGLVAGAFSSLVLGVGFSVMPEPSVRASHKSSGIYRLVRHPIYTFVLIIGVGLFFSSARLLRIPIIAVLYLLLRVKSGIEERFLIGRFDTYAAYASRTGRFIPFVGKREDLQATLGESEPPIS